MAAMTEDEVRAFQRSQLLPETGALDVRTAKAMRTAAMTEAWLRDDEELRRKVFAHNARPDPGAALLGRSLVLPLVPEAPLPEPLFGPLAVEHAACIPGCPVVPGSPTLRSMVLVAPFADGTPEPEHVARMLAFGTDTILVRTKEEWLALYESGVLEEIGALAEQRPIVLVTLAWRVRAAPAVMKPALRCLKHLAAVVCVLSPWMDAVRTAGRCFVEWPAWTGLSASRVRPCMSLCRPTKPSDVAAFEERARTWGWPGWGYALRVPRFCPEIFDPSAPDVSPWTKDEAVPRIRRKKPPKPEVPKPKPWRRKPALPPRPGRPLRARRAILRRRALRRAISREVPVESPGR